MDDLKDLQFNNHNHDGINSFRIKPIDLLALTQQVTDATVAPTDTPINGTERVLFDGTHYVRWTRINKLWKHINYS